MQLRLEHDGKPVLYEILTDYVSGDVFWVLRRVREPWESPSIATTHKLAPEWFKKLPKFPESYVEEGGFGAKLEDMI